MTYVLACVGRNQARQQRGAILDTYHLLDVIGGAERILLVQVIDVVHLAVELVAAAEVGYRREGVGVRPARRGGGKLQRHRVRRRRPGGDVWHTSASTNGTVLLVSHNGVGSDGGSGI